MRGMVRRVTVVAGAAVAALGLAAGTASASGAPVVNWSPSGTFDYGTLNPGQTAPPQTFTLTNSGKSATSALKIALTVTAGPPSAFTKTADTCTGTSLGPKKACRVTVTYTAPATSQTDQATLTVTGNKPAAAASVTLTGAAKASPTLTTVTSSGGTAGTVALNDTAMLSGGMSPGGSITLSLYDPSQSGCTGTPLYTQTETVSGDGSYSTTNTALAAEAGTWNWTVTYSGDASNNPAASPCGAEPVVVTPAAAAGLSVSGSGSPIAGMPFPVTVTVLDAFGNVVTGFTGTVHFTSTDPSAILPADYTFTASDGGRHTFFSVLTKSGPQMITALDTSNPEITGSELVAVQPAAPASLQLSAPSSTQTGALFSVTVTVQDAYGNVATGYTGTVHFTSSDGLAGLPADYTFTPADGGIHTFSEVSLDTRGSQSITAADTVNSALSDTVTINVN